MSDSSSQNNQDQEEDEIELPEGLDLMQGGGWGEKVSNWFQKNFSSVVLPIIALLILGGGIYMYSQNQAQLQTPAVGPEGTSTEIALDQQKPAEVNKEKKEEQSQPEEKKEDKEAKENKEEKTKKEDKIMGGPVEKEGAEYTVETKSGEGITHLARRTAKKHLENKEGSPELSAEQKIYVEDYLQNRKGTRQLKPGEELSFSQDLVEAAIDASQNLSESQLNNLTQYADQVPSL